MEFLCSGDRKPGASQVILPYLAIALLILVTVYSGLVSFRERPKDAPPTFLFPTGVRPATRIVVSIASLLICWMMVAWFARGAHTSGERSVRFLIPESYTGWVRIDFEIEGTSSLPVKDGQTEVKIPTSGKLTTSSPEQFGIEKDRYFFYSGDTLKPVPKSGAGRLIWGKLNGEEQGASGKRTYEEFFVGTEQQYMDQAKTRIAPSSR